MAALSLLFGIVLSLMTPGLANVPTYKLNNGREIPAIALGTYLGNDKTGMIRSVNKQLRDVIMQAIDVGYRHFDSAEIYDTEGELGEGVRNKITEGRVTREDIFITTKLWNTHHKRDQVVATLRQSLSKMGLNYVDLYLMHWPMGLNENYTYSDVDYLETWRGLEDAVNLGLTKSIGLSNFNKEQTERIIKEGSVKPAVLQIEIHPQIIQTDLVNFAQSQNIIVMGYSPFGSLVMRYGLRFPGPSIDDPLLVDIARAHGKTTPQVVLRWLVDRNIVPVMKTLKYSRLKENIDIFDFELSAKEIQKIYKYNENTRYTFPSFWQSHPYYPFAKVANPIADPFHALCWQHCLPKKAEEEKL